MKNQTINIIIISINLELIVEDVGIMSMMIYV